MYEARKVELGGKEKREEGEDGGMGLRRERLELDSRSCRDSLKIKRLRFFESFVSIERSRFWMLLRVKS